MEQVPRLSRVEFALGTEFNECSIIAAEVAQRAEELFDDPVMICQKELIAVDKQHGAQKVTVDTVSLSPVMPTPVGRNIQLCLTRQVGSNNDNEADRSITLMAITRNDVAFPIARFSRRYGTSCDYVQIGSEIENENLVVTPRDQTSRKDIMESLRDLLDLETPAPDSTNELIAHALIGFSEEKLSKELNAEREDKLLLVDRISDAVTKNGAELAALCKVVGIGLPYDFGAKSLPHLRGYISRDDDTFVAFTTRRRIAKISAELDKFFENPDFESIIERTVPGSQFEQGRHLLILETAVRLGLIEKRYEKYVQKHVDPYNRDYKRDMQRGVLNTAIKLLDVEGQIEERFGSYDSDMEKIVSLVGKLALKPGTYLATQELQISNTEGDAELFVEVKPKDDTKNFVSVRVRPAAMPESQPTNVFSLVIDRSEIQQLPPEEAEELVYILGKVASSTMLPVKK